MAEDIPNAESPVQHEMTANPNVQIEASEGQADTVNVLDVDTSSIRMIALEPDEDTTSTSTPAAPSPASRDAPPPQAPPSGPITRARARELNFIMLLKNEGPEE